MVSQNHVLDLIPAYVLGSLGQEETVQVSEHLTQCASCREELQAYQQVVDELALAVPGVTPPADLKPRILRRLPEKRASAEQVQRAPGWLGFWSRLQAVSPVWAFASLFLIVVLSASNVWLWQRVSRLETAAQDGFRMVALVGTGPSPQASGMLVLSHDGDMGTLVVDGLPALDDAHTYQVWLIRGNQWTNGGVFTVSSDGYEAMRIYSDQPLKSFPAFEVTIEPTGGSPNPTGDKVLSGSL
jgi:anti-sigma-K factor RskA